MEIDIYFMGIPDPYRLGHRLVVPGEPRRAWNYVTVRDPPWRGEKLAGVYVDNGFVDTPDNWNGNPRCKPKQNDATLWTIDDKGDKWTVLAMADYTVDVRPGSHATFIARGHHDVVLMLDLIESAFPHIYARLNNAVPFDSVEFKFRTINNP